MLTHRRSLGLDCLCCLRTGNARAATARSDGAPAWLPGPLPLYWPNLPSQRARATMMTAQLDKVADVHHVRINATTQNRTRLMEEAGTLWVQATIIDSCRAGGGKKLGKMMSLAHTHGDCSEFHKLQNPQFSRAELAATTSHLRTIETAFRNGDAVALIIEDDVTIPRYFASVIGHVLVTAPKGWEIIQFSPMHPELLAQLGRVHDHFVNWMPQHKGTGAYLINRQGMASIVARFTKDTVTVGGKRRSMITIPGRVVVADELIYTFLNAYTYTRTDIGFASPLAFPSAIHVSAWAKQNAEVLGRLIDRGRSQCKPAIAPVIKASESESDSDPDGAVPKTMLAATLYRDMGSGWKTAQNSISALARNVGAMQAWGFRWHVFVLLLDDGGTQGRLTDWQQEKKRHPELDSTVRLIFRAVKSPATPSKWVYYREVTARADISSYTNVIFVDGAMDFAGFAWGEFFLRHQAYGEEINHKLVGVSQQMLSESLQATRRTYNAWHAPMDGTYWQHCHRNEASALPVDLIEQFFVMMDTDFMIWFMSHAMSKELVETHLKLGTDYGIETIWCGAAREYHSHVQHRAASEKCEDNVDYRDKYGFGCGDWYGFSCDQNKTYCEPDGTTCWSPAELQTVKQNCCATCRASEAMRPKCLLIPLTMKRRNADLTSALAQHGVAEYPFREPKAESSQQLSQAYAEAFPEWAALSRGFQDTFSVTHTDAQSPPETFWCHTNLTSLEFPPFLAASLDRLILKKDLIKGRFASTYMTPLTRARLHEFDPSCPEGFSLSETSPEVNGTLAATHHGSRKTLAQCSDACRADSACTGLSRRGHDGFCITMTGIVEKRRCDNATICCERGSGTGSKRESTFRNIVSKVPTLASGLSLQYCDARMPVHSGATLAATLKVYWVNLATATQRAVTMAAKLEKSPGVVHTRVEATDKAGVQRMQNRRQLVVDAAIIETCTHLNNQGNVDCWWHHTQAKVPEYTTVEVACVTSHLRTIDLAFKNGDDLALITEDDVIIPTNIAAIVADLLPKAPRSWEIIQFSPKNGEVLKQFKQIHDLFVSWMPQYYGTGSYLINRRGMKVILDKFTRSEPHPGILLAGADQHPDLHTTFMIPADVVVADELIYAFVNTYTATRVYIGFESTSAFPSAVQQGSWTEGSKEQTALDNQVSLSMAAADCTPSVVPVAHHDKIVLAITVYRDSDDNDKMMADLATLADNVIATQPWGFHYHVFVILKTAKRQSAWEREVAAHSALNGDTVQLHFRTNPARFSKWIYWHEVTQRSDVTNFSNTIFVDGDLDFAGFPWGEFFLRHAAYLGQYEHKIIGVTRQSHNESMLSTKTSHNSWYTAIDGEYWHHCGRGDVVASPVDFLEQFFVMMDTGFMLWFMSHVLDEHFLGLHRTLATDYGIDTLWCGAAREYHQITNPDDTCVDDPDYTDIHGFDCTDWANRDCLVQEEYCVGSDNQWCYAAQEIREVRSKCCSCTTNMPRCLLVPLIMNHKDTRSLTGNRDSKSKAFSDFEIAGSTLAQRYLDQFPEWAVWASRFRDFFSGAWPAQRCFGQHHLNDGGRLPLRAPSLAQNMANSKWLSVLDNFELDGRPGLGPLDGCPSTGEVRRSK